MGEVNIVVGLSGVGKGTVLEEAMLLANKEYKTINYGDRMLEIAKEEDLLEHRNKIKKLEPETIKRIQEKAAESIIEDSEEEDVVLETHSSIKTPYGYLPGLPKSKLEALEPEKIVMIHAAPKAIYKRRKKDSSRQRENREIEEIKEYQNVSREMASTGAVLTGAHLKILENPHGKAQRAAEELVELLRS